MAALKATFLRDVKNFSPQGAVPDDVMQSAVANVLQLIESAFGKAGN
jgi:hypothetical protein